jgi:hypothetical protein
MRLCFSLLLALILLPLSNVYAAFYQWTDDSGVLHFTDTRKKIPKKYQKKAKEVTPPGKSSPAASNSPAPAPMSEPRAMEEPSGPAAAPLTPGGHPEQWWRQRFTALRRELKALQDELPLKQVRLAELRRERRIFTRARDREAINVLEAELNANEARRAEIARELEILEQDAARAEVPAEWRR